ncbi:MAG: TetR/AcrR family transcriptional regulator [Sulfurovaceae bacterium]|nr:TetR/AcrR family transcriptional regulator [Sulfurovaceae bacterium]MDD5548786.1 TetR/AcrR family transcriptional regulator [Sulfurovaceae bacterium]
MANAKEKILETALYLFNTQGSRLATTNHIAKACGISPGNLYYHYKNKEEIIRALFVQMGGEWELKIEDVTEVNFALFEEIKQLSHHLTKKYHFIHAELYALCQNDPELTRLNQETITKRKAQTKALLEMLILHEDLVPLGTEEMEFLVDSIWLYAIFWQPYNELVNPERLESVSIASTDILLGKFLVKKDK